MARDEVGGHAGHSDGGLAAEGLKRRLVDDPAAILFLELHPHPQHVAAIGAAHGADGVGVGHFAEVLRVGNGGLDVGFEIVAHEIRLCLRGSAA
jgi:hypothetical protein